jgi:hypothetical protein
MIRILLTFAVCLALTACGGSAPQEASPVGTASPATTSEPDRELFDPVDDLGDLEQGIDTEVRIPEADRPEGAAVRQLEDFRNNITMATVDLSEPFPTSLVATVQVKPSRSFPDPPAVVRVRIKRDDEVLATHEAVVGRMATGSEKAKELTWQVDVLAGLETMPETMLVVAETDLLLMPLGTVEETIDPATADVAATRKTMKPSNPLRINFNAGDAS